LTIEKDGEKKRTFTGYHGIRILSWILTRVAKIGENKNKNKNKNNKKNPKSRRDCESIISTFHSSNDYHHCLIAVMNGQRS